MKIEVSKKFKERFNERIASNSKLANRVRERILLLKTHPNDPILRLHQLKGTMYPAYSLSVTGDIRIILNIRGRTATLIDIGTHKQVYISD